MSTGYLLPDALRRNGVDSDTSQSTTAEDVMKDALGRYSMTEHNARIAAMTMNKPEQHHSLVGL